MYSGVVCALVKYVLHMHAEPGFVNVACILGLFCPSDATRGRFVRIWLVHVVRGLDCRLPRGKNGQLQFYAGTCVVWGGLCLKGHFIIVSHCTISFFCIIRHSYAQ